jgi:hypothetical protein
MILTDLTESTGDLTIPIMMNYLTGPAKPNRIKAEIVFTILQYRHNDPVAMKAVDSFLTLPSMTDPSLRTAALSAIRRARFVDPVISSFLLQSLNDPSKFVKIAAIRTARALGSDSWNQAVPTVTKFSTDPSQDMDVRIAAEQAIKNDMAPATVGPRQRPPGHELILPGQPPPQPPH